MREIKFRQAIFKDGVFHHWHYWGWLPKEGYISDSYDHFVGPIEIKQASWDRTYEVKLSQQYIGLSDKSTLNELYEGDIIKDFKGRILQIAYAQHYARYMASIDGEWCIYYLNDGTTGGQKRSAIYWRDTNMGFAEKIGNIYENPELLRS